MKFSERWLREWVNVDADVDGLCAALTMAGLEVDGYETLGEDHGAIVAEVIAMAPHPEADRLNVCTVEIGSGDALQIVCGAPNVQVGMKVPLLPVGSQLPAPATSDSDASQKPIVIKAAKIRGVQSFGMLASAAELGLGDDNSGLMELSPEAETGARLAAVLGLPDNVVEIELTPNRGDCLSVRGVAREAGVLFDVPVNEPDIVPVEPSIEDVLPIELAAPDACPRYLGRVIKGVNGAASTPIWLQERLRRAGVRSIDPIVDVTNYVLLELGQPMHAFDLAQVHGGIVVRQARSGESLTLLDGRTIELAANTLVIADQHQPIALAGIMGGEESGIADEAGAGSRDVFLECAWFAPLAIVGRPRQYGLHTEASQRYERGVDYALQHAAMERATGLLLQIAGGAAGPIIDATVAAELPMQTAVALRASRLRLIAGCNIPAEQVTQTLTRLGMTVSVRGAGADQVWEALPPSHRFDIEREEDLIEEVIRVFGYDNIPDADPIAGLPLASAPEADKTLRALRGHVTAVGYQEAITYSFVDPRIQDRVLPGNAGLMLDNPMSLEMAQMRLSLWPGLLQAAAHNQQRQQARLRLFETGLCFLPEAGGLAQVPRLGGVLAGVRHDENWASDNEATDFFDLKGDVEHLLRLAGLAGAQFTPLAADAAPAAPACAGEKDPRYAALHPGQSADIQHGGARIGLLGRLHPNLLDDLKLTGDVFVFELDLERVLQGAVPVFAPISRFPSVVRDIAVLLDNSTPAASVLRVARAEAGGQLVDLKLFDVYSGERIDSNKKSVALRLTFQDPSRTLNENEVTERVDAVVARLGAQFQAELR